MNLPIRKCHCAGNCGPQQDGLSRRDFIGLIGAGTAGAFLATPAFGASYALEPEAWEQWKRELMGPAKPRVYRSDKHADARMHLGGIGTGNFEIGADGQLTTWQLFNTLRDGHVPFHFGVKAGGTARLLQTTGGPEAPRVRQIEMTGEYPAARLRFSDPALPVNIELEAFSPFAPLDTRLSSTPLAAFVFRLTNPTTEKQSVSLAAFLQNAVGYDAAGRIEGDRHPNFEANINEPLQEGRARGLFMRAEKAGDPVISEPVQLFVSANLNGLFAPPADRPKQLTLQTVDKLRAGSAKSAEAGRTVVWLEEAPADLPEPLLRAARDAVLNGATLLLAGKSMPLLQTYAQVTGGKPLAKVESRPDMLFEDFEKDYSNWRVEGRAFGAKPAAGTLSGQQRVSGFLGRGVVNTFLEGDATTGRLLSRDFPISRHYLRFLVGGGSQPSTQIRLLVDGKIVRSAAGRDEERLQPVSWDVREFEGRTAHLEIVDEATGPWGHINVDQIEFSDQPANEAVFHLLEELLPARFAGVRSIAPTEPGQPGAIQFEQLEPLPGTVSQPLANGLARLSHPVGKGQVVLVGGAMLDPGQSLLVGARRQALAAVLEIAGVSYTVPAGVPGQAPGFGTLALAALGTETTVFEAFDDWSRAWGQFAKDGKFTAFEQAKASAPTPRGRTVHGAVATTIELPANGAAEVVFLLAWHFPNKYNGGGQWMGCQYATLWPDAKAVIREAAGSFDQWRGKTESFRRAFYDSTLPYWLLDCVTANAAIIRHIGVVFRIANGDVYGWEGSNGCCQPTCTHVWGYEQTLSRLFPDLERDMRRIDFKHQQLTNGGVNNRTDVPSPARPTGEQPFADGHASCILKAYREALNSPDESFFKEYWPNIQRAVDYLIARDAKLNGGQPGGILQDDQWNTYDQALHGVTTFISGYYLAALRAGEEWARRMGEAETADRFHRVFEKGQQRLIELCWNGEYFQQWLPEGANRDAEVGPGCMADQLIGQWWAHQLGLGYILPKDKVISSLRSVFKYNFKSDLTGWPHSPRAFAGAKDKGLLIVAWPKGGRPNRVMLYSDEVWTGIEYQVAAHMIYEGLTEEGFAVVKAARDRYDGVARAPMQRNPWNEIECGGHYARALSSWSLLLALSGYEYDGPKRQLRLFPRHTPENFKAFFCGPEGWGTVRQSRDGRRQEIELAVVDGALALAQLTVPGPVMPERVTLTAGGQSIECEYKAQGGTLLIQPRSALKLTSGQKLTVITS